MRNSVFVFILAFPLSAQVVTIQPASTHIGVGSTDRISILISGVTDLYAFGFDLEFAADLNALGVNEGSFLPEAGSTFFIRRNDR